MCVYEVCTTYNVRGCTLHSVRVCFCTMKTIPSRFTTLRRHSMYEGCSGYVLPYICLYNATSTGHTCIRIGSHPICNHNLGNMVTTRV